MNRATKPTYLIHKRIRAGLRTQLSLGATIPGQASGFGRTAASGLVLFALLTFMSRIAAGKGQESPGYSMEFAAAESEVLPIVKGVSEDSIVRGTYVYERDKTLSGAVPAKSSNAFEPWTGPGEVFYKVANGVIAPRHFDQSADMGTITVRYVVQSIAESRTRVRIDAIYIEAARRRAHASDGTVEASELKAIQEKLQELQLAQEKVKEERNEAAEKEKNIEEQRAAEQAAEQSENREREQEAARLSVAESSIQGLQQRLSDLRRQVEVRVKSANTQLKTAPFEKASDLAPLDAGAELAVIILTPQWYGVEAPDGRRGWLRRDQVEQLP